MSSQSHTAIVTGAANGIGRAVALRLASDGFNVAICDISSQEAALKVLKAEIEAKGQKALAVVANVSVEKEVNDFVSTVVSQFGGLDVMVANAGVAVLTSILETTMEEWEHVFNTNVRGTLLCYRAAAKVMIEQNRGGRIIGASSLAGKKSAALCSTYGSTKFAIRSLTQTAACEFGKFNITVNAYAPGLTDTPLLTNMDARIGQLMGAGPGAYKEMMKGQTALGRIAEPEEIASLVSFLASKESSFITGQTISIDGGIWFD
ncbi:hypothetical protein Ac2012v2_006200 [Leucoagaricus gongylophorus]